MPDIARAEAALRQSSSGMSRCPSANQDRARSAENRISRASEPSGSTSRPSSIRSRTPNRSRSSRRHVHPAVDQVLAQVTQDVGLLQGDAERVGVPGAAGSGLEPNTPRQSRPTAPATHRQYVSSSAKVW